MCLCPKLGVFTLWDFFTLWYFTKWVLMYLLIDCIFAQNGVKLSHILSKSTSKIGVFAPFRVNLPSNQAFPTPNFLLLCNSIHLKPGTNPLENKLSMSSGKKESTSISISWTSTTWVVSKTSPATSKRNMEA